MHPVHNIKHFKTTFSMEDAQRQNQNISGPPWQAEKILVLTCEHFKVKVTGHLHVWYFKDTVMGQNTSSRTLACIISEGHNGDGIEHKFKDIWICNKQKHNSYRPYLQVKDLCIFNQQFILQHQCYTILHTSMAREALPLPEATVPPQVPSHYYNWPVPQPNDSQVEVMDILNKSVTN